MISFTETLAEKYLETDIKRVIQLEKCTAFSIVHQITKGVTSFLTIFAPPEKYFCHVEKFGIFCN